MYAYWCERDWMFKKILYCQVTFFSTLSIHLSCLSTRPICVVLFRILRQISSLKCCLTFILNTTIWWAKSKDWVIANALCHHKNPIGLYYVFSLQQNDLRKYDYFCAYVTPVNEICYLYFRLVTVMSRHFFLYYMHYVSIGILFLKLYYLCSFKMMFSY